MESPIIMYQSSKELFNKASYSLLFSSNVLLLFSAYLAIPVFSIPGNTILFQLSIWEFKDYAVMIPLSFLVALMITMQVYIFRRQRKTTVGEMGKSAVGGYSGIVAGVFGTASCSSCVAAIFGFLGTGGVFFLVQYQWYVVVISVILVLLSLYLSSVSMQKNCKDC